MTNILKWYVVKTKPKKEENVKCQLAHARFDVFLPKIKTWTSSKPLFPSYIFVRTNFEDPRMHRMVQFTRGVSHILSDISGPVPLENYIIETLREKTGDGSLIEQELLFKTGDEVTVKKGILKDLVGIIEKNISDEGRVKVLFKWFSGNMRAVLKYTELEKAA